MTTNQSLDRTLVNQSSSNYGWRLPPLILRPKWLTFKLVFILVFLLSGILTIATFYSYRMGLVSLLVIPLVFLYGLTVDRVLIAYFALTGVVLLSALYNQSSITQIILFMRILGFSYLMYYLVLLAVKPRVMTKVLRACITIASIQLPIILLQWSFFERLPSLVKDKANPLDIGFGTFNFMSDYAMVFFVILVTVFLLFNGDKHKVVRGRWMLITWLSLTVIVSNAQITKLILVLVWLFYLCGHLRLKTILTSAIAFLLLVPAAAFLNNSGLLTEDINSVIVKLTPRVTAANTEAYLSGSFDRSAGIAYVYQHAGLLGDGPSAYSNPIGQVVVRGNHGHFLTFTSEVGWVGLLLSMLILYLIALPLRLEWRRLTICWPALVIFLGITILAFTSDVMNDISVMLSYCLMAQYYRTQGTLPTTRTVLTW